MPDPMLDLGLFKRPAMTGVSVTAFTLSSSIFAMFLYLTIYLQDVLGYSPFAAGLRFLPITVLSFVVAPFAGKLTVQVKSRYLLGLGLLLIALACKLTNHSGPIRRGRSCCPASSSPASGSAWSTRSWPRPPCR